MKNLMKLIVITAVTALLFCMVITCASADEKIYTSPTFKLPNGKVNGWLDQLPEEGEEPEEEPEEKPEDEDEDLDEDEEEPEDQDEEETGSRNDSEKKTDENGKPEKAKRAVKISTTQGKVVKKNEYITLSSKLIGIEKEEILSYQWQVDRGDGKGWVDIEGANGDKYVYIATAETITYKWRLIVDVNE